MGDKKKDIERELDNLREMEGRLKGDMDEKEALDMLEKAVEEVEKYGKKLEEE